jgi:hypothetical protein
MQNSKLPPSRETLERAARESAEEWELADELYARCVEEFRMIRLCDVDADEVRRVMRVFLVVWGQMGRILLDKRREGWEGRVAEAIRRNAPFLESIRDQELVKAELEATRGEIERAYDDMMGIVGPTATSKVLHLVAPSLFPMWDGAIRKELVKEDAGIKTGATGKDYYNFMLYVQSLAWKLDETLSELELKYGKSKVKLLDECLWSLAHNQN